MAHIPKERVIQIDAPESEARALDPCRELERELFQSQKLETVGHLTAGVAHDFNNLLSVITSHGEVLRDELPPDDYRVERLDEILNAAERAASLTQQLLTFSRKRASTPEAVDLNVVTANIFMMLRRLVDDRITFDLQLSPGVGMILGERTLLEQVIVNLVLNARDAMPEGGTLRIISRRVDPDANDGSGTPYLCLSVEDTGEGMSEQVVERIFEPFFTTKDADRGTGLGLSTVLRIVRELGGTLRVESAEGRGSRFDVYLPRLEEKPPDEAVSPLTQTDR